MVDDSFFIVIEGMDGSGKSSLARYLYDTLRPAYGDGVALTYEPHDPSAAGQHIRDVLAKRKTVSALSLAYAFAHNRVDHLHNVIAPHLEASGKRIVICDRYVLSSLVYQSTDCLSMEKVYALNCWARPPDITLYLNVTPQNCYARMRQRPTDRELFEKNLAERARRYSAGIKLLRAKGEAIIAVDANPDFEEVSGAVLQVLKAQAPAWLQIQPPLLLDWHESDSAK